MIVVSYPLCVQSRKQAEGRVGSLCRHVDVIGGSIDASDDHILPLPEGLG